MSKIICGKTPEKVLQILVICDLVLATIGAVAYVIAAVLVMVFSEAENSGEVLMLYFWVLGKRDPTVIIPETSKVTGFSIFFVVLMFYLLELYLFKLISDGMRIESYNQCGKWYIYRLGLFLVNRIIFFTLNVVLGALSDDEYWFNPFDVIFYLLTIYEVYELVVGGMYLKDLKDGVSSKGIVPDWQIPKFNIP